jgi:hypothetical protein
VALELRGLRRNNDRKSAHRYAQFAHAVVFLISTKLINYRNRWMPGLFSYPPSLLGRIASRGPLRVLTFMEMMVEGLVPHR